jgi:hypothetical protein
MNQKIVELGNVLAKATELFEEIKNSTDKQDAQRGNTVTVAGKEWLVLKVEDNKVYCLLKELLDSKKFDSDSSDWKESSLRDYLNDKFYEELAEKIAAENILDIPVNLLSLDGQTEYGSCTDKVSLLTVDMYRENRDILPNMDKWWWLVTPFSTPCNDYETYVCVVSPGGFIDYFSCGSYYAVRPFCIFDSSIFES